MNAKSATTSINQVPSLHKRIVPARAGKWVFDFGAGKKGKVDEWMSEAGIFYFPYDPFNRTAWENGTALEAIIGRWCDYVLCANVLNVLEDEYLGQTIEKLANITHQTKDNVCFISVYHNSRLAKNRSVNGHFQRNEPIGWYLDHLTKHFSVITKIRGGFLKCTAK